MDNPQICCPCWSMALGRAHVPMSTGRKGGEAASLHSKRIFLHAGPGATQPQTCTCMHQTRTQPLHRAELPRSVAEPCWRWHHPVCTHRSNPCWLWRAERAADGAVPSSKGREYSRTSTFLAPDTHVYAGWDCRQSCPCPAGRADAAAFRHSQSPCILIPSSLYPSMG